jgi:hypothetical protein
LRNFGLRVIAFGMKSRVVAAATGLILLLGIVGASGCDLCGCYSPQLQIDPNAPLGPQTANSWARGFYVAIGEQFTHFGTLQLDGREVANPTGQYLDSSIAQFVAGYSVTSRFALQLNVPFIYRSFERPEGFAIDRGTESGLGDISLLGKFVVWRTEAGARREMSFDNKSSRIVAGAPDFTASVVLIGGVKFPTGESSRLKEEFNEIEIPGAPESGIHGHDLTLGTGSYDGIFGGQGSLRYGNVFFQAETQFTLRGAGRHQYRFANDITWSGGPGYYFVRRKDAVLGLQCVVSGEHKDVDRFRGRGAQDTGITSVLVGPRIVASWKRFSGEIEIDLPVSIQNTALQAVSDYRLRGGVAFSF